MCRDDVKQNGGIGICSYIMVLKVIFVIYISLRVVAGSPSLDHDVKTLVD